ncbi:hypothetical protein ACE2AJ_07585 [Aquihabitans daechungensis]|uniref:hypothetical protein n=1 Tax=Aquihabitans daechungensis TaxID=1052257 RepID=UPI003BA320A8
MRRLLVIASVLTLAVVGAGCGSSGGSDPGGDATTTTAEVGTTTTEASGEDAGGATAEEYTAAYVVNLSSGKKDEGNLVLTEEEAACVAPRFVDVITAEALREGEVTPADVEDPSFEPSDVGLSVDQGTQLVDAFGACDVDIIALFVESFTLGMTPEQQACAAENVDPDLTKALLVKSLSTEEADAEFEAVLDDLDADCNLPG